MYVTTFPCHNCAKHIFSMQSTRWYARIRKDKEGNVIKWNEKCASLRNPMSLYNYIDMEKAAFKQYAEETAIISIPIEHEI